MLPPPTTEAKQYTAVHCTDCDQVCPTVANELTAQCTDQCVVVACRDPTHDVPLDCNGHKTPGRCDLVCDSTTDCVDCNGFDAFLQCCNDYHGYLSEPKPTRPAHCAPPPPGWDASSWNWCDDCNHSQDSGSPSTALPPTQFNSSDFIVAQQHQHQQQQQQHHHHHQQSQQQHQDPVYMNPPPLTEKCMWSNCNASFATLSDLIGHVNVVHLHPSTVSNTSPLPPMTASVNDPTSLNLIQTLPCLWNDCSTDVNPQDIPGPSSAPELASNTFTALEVHLLRDHLGLNLTYLESLKKRKVADNPGSDTRDANMDLGVKEPSPSSDINQCMWEGCGEHFASCELLTAHLNAFHVGSGRAHYECFWQGCNRNRDQGFSSKQKICRHLQSHTGHRPFQCKICQQNFSEAATLQQHMRRHTQERPYVCDFPNCGKSFAIMGALTIHKRIHNGVKPFKCKFCEKAFSESSNLSKHLRTHTGARPYGCPEAGCGKSFARPDQLNRHIGVHKRSPIAEGIPAS